MQYKKQHLCYQIVSFVLGFCYEDHFPLFLFQDEINIHQDHPGIKSIRNSNLVKQTIRLYEQVSSFCSSRNMAGEYWNMEFFYIKLEFSKLRLFIELNEERGNVQRSGCQ